MHRTTRALRFSAHDSGAASPKPNGRRVLVVDDDRDIRSFISLALADEGYEVVSAANGAIALERAEEYPPDVILLDVNMPVLDGHGFVEAYRKRSGPQAPVVVLTAAHEAARQAIRMQAATYLGKPFDLEELLSIVERLTKRARGSREVGDGLAR